MTWPLLLLLSGLAAAYGGAVLQHRASTARQREALGLRLAPVRAALSREVFGATHLTEGIASLIAIDGGISEPKFRALASELFHRTDLIRNMAVAPDNVVAYVYPSQGNELASGLNYAESSGQWPSVERMMRARRMVIAGPVALVQGGVGVIGRSPIYVPGSARDGPHGRRYWGLTSTVLDFEKLLVKAKLTPSPPELSLALRGVDGLGERGPTFWGNGAVFQAQPVVLDVPLPSGSWQLAAVPRGGWPPLSVLHSSAFWLGALLSGVLSFLLLRLLQAAAARESEVVQRRRAEVSLTRLNGALDTYSQIKGIVVQAQDEASLFSGVCRVSVGAAGYREASIVRMDGSGDSLELLAHAGTTDRGARPLHASDARRVEEALRRCFETKAPFISRPSPVDPGSNEESAVLAAPLWLDGSVIAAIAFRTSEADAFADAELELLEDLATTIAHGISALRARQDRQVALDALGRAREELEERVIARTQELVVARDAAESADRLKSAFLATMSHELRTPLNSIIGFTSILRQGMAGPLSDEQSKQLGMVYGSAKHLLALINDILDLSKMQAGQLRLVLETVDIRATLHHVAATLQAECERKGLTLEIRVPANLGQIQSDRRRLEQVLLNLLSNATKFTNSGAVRLEAKRDDERISVWVSDTGPGIPHAQRGLLFQPFSQLDSGLDRKHEGTGLGLSICKHLVELLGGAIWVRSDEGGGSTFGFDLPVLPDSRTTVSEAAMSDG